MRKQKVWHFFYIFATMKVKLFITTLVIACLISCRDSDEHKTVICIPVYGQSLALGIEADRITDFDSLANYADGRIVTENMDHRFGYYNLNEMKLLFQKLFHYQKHANELSSYSMAQWLADHTGNDTLICIFPGGADGTIISELGKGTLPYQKLIKDIETAYQSAIKRGWDFEMPALCWMQGETDVNSYPGTNYRELILKLYHDINHDVKEITGQDGNVEFICYQTNQITRAKDFNPLMYNCVETKVPQTQLELVRDNPAFYASGPTYPYKCVNDIIHIDGNGQMRLGILAALSAYDILKHQKVRRGLLVKKTAIKDNEIIISFNIPYPPLCFDTIQVEKIENYGFSVITPDNRDIAKAVTLIDNQIHISCTEQPHNCRVRYAVNGEYMKSGRQHGPRGNLRDSQGDSLSVNILGESYPIHNWCYQFDILIK